MSQWLQQFPAGSTINSLGNVQFTPSHKKGFPGLVLPREGSRPSHATRLQRVHDVQHLMILITNPLQQIVCYVLRTI